MSIVAKRSPISATAEFLYVYNVIALILIVEQMLDCPECPRIVRVYGEMQERMDFQIPRDLLQPNNRKQMASKRLKDISLHFLIRQLNKPYSGKIRQFDQQFVENLETPENVTDDQLEEYRKLILKASIEELKNYDVVLCTSSGSSSKRMRGTNIAQIIIDECAMCMEPDALIPLVAFKAAEQVVLIGDHKQLQPIVINRHAKNLGLQISLFERYANKALMLDLQYRMVWCSWCSLVAVHENAVTVTMVLAHCRRMVCGLRRHIVYCFLSVTPPTKSTKFGSRYLVCRTGQNLADRGALLCRAKIGEFSPRGSP